MAGQQHDELLEFERQLAAVKPRRAQVNRAELLFRAGQESVRADRTQPSGRRWVWQLSTAVLTVVAVGLSWRLQNLEPETVERIQYVQVVGDAASTPQATVREETPRPDAAAPQTPLSREHYLHQRRLAVHVGLDALGDPWSDNAATRSGVTSYRDLRADYFRPHAGSHQASSAAPNQPL